mmetsp:Transcript_88974/g.276556  ORF Transcript_88974/g.276556 Transcript_88974/m.276556 type:complete len:371 (+) Transcript_88974:262-1374(+)
MRGVVISCSGLAAGSAQWPTENTEARVNAGDAWCRVAVPAKSWRTNWPESSCCAWHPPAEPCPLTSGADIQCMCWTVPHGLRLQTRGHLVSGASAGHCDRHRKHGQRCRRDGRISPGALAGADRRRPSAPPRMGAGAGCASLALRHPPHAAGPDRTALGSCRCSDGGGVRASGIRGRREARSGQPQLRRADPRSRHPGRRGVCVAGPPARHALPAGLLRLPRRLPRLRELPGAERGVRGLGKAGRLRGVPAEVQAGARGRTGGHARGRGRVVPQLRRPGGSRAASLPDLRDGPRQRHGRPPLLRAGGRAYLPRSGGHERGRPRFRLESDLADRDIYALQARARRQLGLHRLDRAEPGVGLLRQGGPPSAI